MQGYLRFLNDNGQFSKVRTDPNKVFIMTSLAWWIDLSFGNMPLASNPFGQITVARGITEGVPPLSSPEYILDKRLYPEFLAQNQATSDLLIGFQSSGVFRSDDFYKRTLIHDGFTIFTSWPIAIVGEISLAYELEEVRVSEIDFVADIMPRTGL